MMMMMHDGPEELWRVSQSRHSPDSSGFSSIQHKKKGYSLVRDTGSQCFTVLHSPLLFLVLSLLASYPLVRLAHCLLYGIARFIDAHSHNVSIHTPPIFISLIYLVCTNFPGIGRNEKTFIDCMHPWHGEVIGIAGFMRGG